MLLRWTRGKCLRIHFPAVWLVQWRIIATPRSLFTAVSVARANKQTLFRADSESLAGDRCLTSCGKWLVKSLGSASLDLHSASGNIRADSGDTGRRYCNPEPRLVHDRRFCFSVVTLVRRGRDSSVGIATCYGLDGPGIEFRWGRDFPHPSRPALYNGFRVCFLGVKLPGRGVDHPPPSSAEVKKKRIKLYLYSPSVPSWPVIGWALPLLYLILASCRLRDGSTFPSRRLASQYRLCNLRAV
jgi:hypothetical protein